MAGRSEPLSAPSRAWVPALLTVGGAVLGAASAMAFAAGTIDRAVLLWWAAVLLDQLDGPVARRLEATSARGAALDALSDTITYGVAPFAACGAAGELGLAGGAVALAVTLLRLADDLVGEAKGVQLGAPAVILVAGLACLGRGLTGTEALVWGLLAVVWLGAVRRAPRGLRVILGLLGVWSVVVCVSRM
jgi:phosphatidylserine synthase